jgi:hypothetical protein
VYPTRLWCGGRTHSLGGEGGGSLLARSGSDSRILPPTSRLAATEGEVRAEAAAEAGGLVGGWAVVAEATSENRAPLINHGNVPINFFLYSKKKL